MKVYPMNRESAIVSDLPRRRKGNEKLCERYKRKSRDEQNWERVKKSSKELWALGEYARREREVIESRKENRMINRPKSELPWREFYIISPQCLICVYLSLKSINSTIDIGYELVEKKML